MDKMGNLLKQLINSFKPIFDQFPELISLPIFAWGRFHKYELAGHPFQRSANEGFQDLKDFNLEKINGKPYQKMTNHYQLKNGMIYGIIWMMTMK
jgi:hypothetical protein